MTLVAPVNLPFDIKTLWFDPKGLELHAGDKVVVKTARGLELGTCAGDPFEVEYEEVKKLKSSLKPVVRVATEEDILKSEEMERLSHEAMPVFRQMAQEINPDMHPVTVEYLLDGDKAIFYFEAEERIDFRELVRKLASHFHIRIDMRQIGVRDEARIIGGIAHCGQVVCCKRLGGEFKPVSIRMAKDQDLSLNPQKISGLCGRLMCCLRYEDEAYKDFKARAPKVGAVVKTPDGDAKVVELDVPKEEVALKLEDAKPIRIPIAGFVPAKEGERPNEVTEDAWEEAQREKDNIFGASIDIFQTSKLTGTDKLGSAKAIHHEKRDDGAGSSSSNKGKRKRRRSSGDGAAASSKDSRSTHSEHNKRRRSTKIVGNEVKTEKVNPKEGSSSLRPGHKSSALSHSDSSNNNEKSNKSNKRKRSKSSNANSKNKSSKNAMQSGSKKKDSTSSSTNAGAGSEAKKDSSASGGSSNRQRKQRRRSSGAASDKKDADTNSSSGQ